MEPTLQIGDRIVVNKLSYHLHGVDRTNIVVFRTPPNEDCAGPPVADLVKRVIGLPGEIISLQDGNVYINGRLLPEPFLPPDVRNDTYPGPGAMPTRCTTPTAYPPGTSTSWVTTGPTRATVATGDRSASRPSSARSTCGSGRCPGSGSSTLFDAPHPASGSFASIANRQRPSSGQFGSHVLRLVDNGGDHFRDESLDGRPGAAAAPRASLPTRPPSRQGRQSTGTTGQIQARRTGWRGESSARRTESSRRKDGLCCTAPC